MVCRGYQGFVKKPWKELTSNERLVWEQLGWTSESWTNPVTAPVLSTWDNLEASQKSALTYGMNIDAVKWNELVRNRRLLESVGQSGGAVVAAPTSTKTVQATATKIAWSAVKVIAPVINLVGSLHPAAKVANLAVQQIPTLMDEFSDPAMIPAGGLETVLYLDDSGSMRSNLSLGKSVLTSMADLLREAPTRIVKFGSGKTVIAPREDEWSTALTCLSWSASSGSTYIWKMIEDDVLRRYRPTPPGAGGRGKLRLMVITDGFDTDSPGQYKGIKGMDPMMKTLLAKGYDVEFHIVVLGQHDSRAQSALKRYKSLTEATGGGYLELSSGWYASEKDPTVRSFMTNLEASNDMARDQQRRGRQKQQYLSDARAGRKENFDWLKQLPP